MIRRLAIRWPDTGPFVGRDGRAIRVLAVSDERDPALEAESNRSSVAPIDAVVGCGDVDPRWLAFLADAFCAPLVYVRGNHDSGGDWDERPAVVPDALASGSTTRVAGILTAGLEWPGVGRNGNARRPNQAWSDAARVAWSQTLRRLRGRREPVLVISHAPPEGVGDADDLYHRGFAGYRMLLDRVRPPLWLHGHTTTASVRELAVESGATTVVNATGAVVVDILPPPAD